ncbi:MAG: T9SS type A sorting domain-containing protein [Bacteroidales bacterium]|nr:T9SS type A sorting domain-containing protein [Bacteroidales bacterium]
MKTYTLIRAIAAIVLLAFSCLNLLAQSIEVSGNVSGLWDMDTVNVIGDIQVREVETLNISSGVKVIFRGPFAFDIQGNVLALGTDTSPILFTMADTTGFHIDTLPDGGWKNIRIENVNPSVDSSIFRYCQFEYGKAVSNDSVHGYGGAFCIRNTHKAAIENCMFNSNYAYYNGGAVYLENASVKICNNHFENNRCGQTFAFYGYGGGICSDWGEPLITHNMFTLNSSTGIGGGLCLRFSDCRVSHNFFINNYSALGGGFGILHIETCKHVIDNNLFAQNGALFFGAGISNGDCSPTYVNNTIADNHCDGGGGGFYCKDSVVPVLYNNIIFGNTQFGGEVNQVYLWDLLSQPNFYFNNIEGGKEDFYGTGGTAYFGEYLNNMDANPMFMAGQFSLMPASPCIDAGQPDTSGLMIPLADLAGNLRMVNGRLDIGAYENQTPVGYNAPSPQTSTDITIYPNPVRDVLHLKIHLKQRADVTINIFNTSGKKVFQFEGGMMKAGVHGFESSISELSLAPGMYHASVEVGTEKWEQKFIVFR